MSAYDERLIEWAMREAERVLEGLSITSALNGTDARAFVQHKLKFSLIASVQNADKIEKQVRAQIRASQPV
ncbi:hypothetical protein [Bosea sp. AS-1]|uniref:hypothetical protein n=1 Tax=Bosea sp. AS-1 TaxID=2015316 RepID=UPI000B77A8C9|nr:hypothetical protein [Bosea sp. AS-1]